MEEAQTHEEKPSFETVWAALKEHEKQSKRDYWRLNKQLGLLSNRFGQMLEHTVKPNLLKAFREQGFAVTRVYQNTRIYDEKNNIMTEVDFTLENGDQVILVEVKSKPDTGDIVEHIERIGKVKAHAALRGDKRVFLGAIAGVVLNDNERNFALKNGFYVLEPSGKTFTITVPEGVYSLREW